MSGKAFTLDNDRQTVERGLTAAYLAAVQATKEGRPVDEAIHAAIERFLMEWDAMDLLSPHGVAAIVRRASSERRSATQARAAIAAARGER